MTEDELFKAVVDYVDAAVMARGYSDQRGFLTPDRAKLLEAIKTYARDQASTVWAVELHLKAAVCDAYLATNIDDRQHVALRTAIKKLRALQENTK